jgi:hypothetical protein
MHVVLFSPLSEKINSVGVGFCKRKGKDKMGTHHQKTKQKQW